MKKYKAFPCEGWSRPASLDALRQFTFRGTKLAWWMSSNYSFECFICLVRMHLQHKAEIVIYTHFANPI